MEEFWTPAGFSLSVSEMENQNLNYDIRTFSKFKEYLNKNSIQNKTNSTTD